MSKTISVADDVYSWMKRNKDDRSFSDYLRQFMKISDLRELEEIGWSGNWEATAEELDKASMDSADKIENRTG